MHGSDIIHTLNKKHGLPDDDVGVLFALQALSDFTHQVIMQILRVNPQHVRVLHGGLLQILKNEKLTFLLADCK